MFFTLVVLTLHHCDSVRQSISKLIGENMEDRYENYILSYTRSKLERECHAIQLHLAKNPTTTNIPPQESKEGSLFWIGTMNLETYVLVKMFKANSTCKSKDIARDSTDAQEAIKLLERLSHPNRKTNVIQLICYQCEQVPYFYVLEILKGGEQLIPYIQKRHQMFQKKSLKIILENIVLPAVKAIEFCHSNNVCLRDFTAESFQVKGFILFHL